MGFKLYLHLVNYVALFTKYGFTNVHKIGIQLEVQGLYGRLLSFTDSARTLRIACPFLRIIIKLS